MSDPVRYLVGRCEGCSGRHDFEGERADVVQMPCGWFIRFRPLKKRTSYVCPDDVGQGHSSLYTGDLRIVTPGDGWCLCGAELVERVEDGRYLVSWEMVGPYDLDFHPVTKAHTTLRDAEQHVLGLRELAAQGEAIRNVTMAAYDLVPRELS
jgi:hypothetical protein